MQREYNVKEIADVELDCTGTYLPAIFNFNSFTADKYM